MRACMKLLVLFSLASPFLAQAADLSYLGATPGGCYCRIQLGKGAKGNALFDIRFQDVILKEQKEYTYPDAITALRECRHQMKVMDVCE